MKATHTQRIKIIHIATINIEDYTILPSWMPRNPPCSNKVGCHTCFDCQNHECEITHLHFKLVERKIFMINTNQVSSFLFPPNANNKKGRTISLNTSLKPSCDAALRERSTESNLRDLQRILERG